jgi:hypothetical protein
MSQPLSLPLQQGIRFFLVPIPAPPTDPLTVHLPAILCWRRYGLTTFPACHTTETGSTSSPTVRRRRNPNFQRVIRPRAFWLEPDTASSFGSSIFTGFISSSLTLTTISQPCSSAHAARTSAPTPHGIDTPVTSGGYVVRKASHLAITRDACFPRLPLVAQRVH